MKPEPWSAALDPGRLDRIRSLIALHPANKGDHDTSRLAHLHLSRLLADMADLDEAAITAVMAAVTAGSSEDEGPCGLVAALDATWRMRLDRRYVLACLASATLRAHNLVNHMERAGGGTSGYHPSQLEAQRRDAAMTLRAFRAWERIVEGND